MYHLILQIMHFFAMLTLETRILKLKIIKYVEVVSVTDGLIMGVASGYTHLNITELARKPLLNFVAFSTL